MIQVTGPAGEKDQKIEDLTITGDSSAIAVTVDAIRPSHWFGGAMCMPAWR